MLVSTGIADPDGQWSPPVAFTRQRPVLDVLQPVTKSPVLDMVGVPGDLLIVLNHLVLELRRADEPRVLGVVEKRCIASPAERVVVFDPLRLEQLPVSFELTPDIGTASLGILTSPRYYFRREFAGKVYKLDKRKSFFQSNVEVVFAKRRRQMNDACAVVRRYVVCGDNAPPTLSLIHISEPTRLGMISYAVFCLKKKKN